jgi:putative transcriptional regulator
MMDLSFTSSKVPAKGSLLLSDPFMDEDYFRRSIVYLCEHNNDGSYGFVLNNFLPINLKDLGDNFPDIETQITLGGPLDRENLYFLHTLGNKIDNAILIKDNIYIGGDFQKLSELLSSDQKLVNKVRFFVGYSSWSIGQLEDEMKNNSWISVKLLSKKDLFEDKLKITWSKYMKSQGGKFKILSDFTISPINN